MDINPCIVILEDIESDKVLIEFELREAGIVFSPIWTNNGKDYVKVLGYFIPDLIISDYALPGYDGSLALAEAKKQCPDVPFILITGLFSDAEYWNIKNLVQGADDYISKYHLEQIAPAVKKALESRGITVK